MPCRRPWFDPWVGKILWRRERLPTPVLWPREFLGVAKSRRGLSDFHFHFQDQDHPADHGKLPKVTSVTAWVTASRKSDCLAWKGTPACLWAWQIMPPVTLLHKSWTLYKWAYQFYGITWDKLVKKLRDIYSKQWIWLLNNWPEAILLGNN